MSNTRSKCLPANAINYNPYCMYVCIEGLVSNVSLAAADAFAEDTAMETMMDDINSNWRYKGKELTL